MTETGMRRVAAAGVHATPAAGLAVRGALRALSPGGRRGRLTVLIFHRVHERRDPLFRSELSADDFRTRMTWVRRWFNILPLDEAVRALASGNVVERALSITFDDGYADNATIALPILRELGVHATFFIASGFLEGGCMWNDAVIEAVRATSHHTLDLTAQGLGRHRVDTLEAKRAAIASLVGALKYLPVAERDAKARAVESCAGVERRRDLMMTQAQARGLAAAGMGIGGHTTTHPILARLSDAHARAEIADGRDALEAIVRQPVRLFAYPNGKPEVDYGSRDVAIVRALGFEAALTTSPGSARMSTGVHELPRFTPWDATPWAWAGRLSRNLLIRPTRAAA